MADIVTSPHRRWPWITIAVFALLLATGTSTWAVMTVLWPADDQLKAADHTYVAIESGEVGASISLNTVVRWTPEPVGLNRAAGVVTSVSVAEGDSVDQGTILFTVDLREIVVARGDVPAFRSIGPGVEGPDVAQLQTMLAELGFYGGAIDGEAGLGTADAIGAWQESLGMERTESVSEGDVIFVPTLPTRISLDTDIVHRGAMLAGAEEIVRALPVSPDFVIPVTDAQAAMISAGTRVEITSSDGSIWQALATDQVPNSETGVVDVYLEGVDGASICAKQCAQIPVAGDVTLPSRVVTVENIAGLVVPSAALVTGADGEIAVVARDGDRIPVTVQASARGMAVVEGVEAGMRVRIPAEESDAGGADRQNDEDASVTEGDSG